jgi:flagellar biosynthesis protein FlhB
MADDDSDKSEEPTSKKKTESLEKGLFPKSQELDTVMILGATLAVMAFSGHDQMNLVSVLTTDILGHLHDVRLNQPNAVRLFHLWAQEMFAIMMPLLAAVCVASILAGGMQTGFKLTPKLLEADMDKINPVNGFKRLFNKKNLVQTLVDVVKIAAMLGILYGLIKDVMNDPIFSAPVQITYIGDFLFKLFTEMLTRLLEVMVVIAVIDYAWQRWKTNEDMKMTKQEVKDEHKQSEGDPHIKGRMRGMAMNILRQSIKKNVPRADVVVTNPTHYAVALKYEQGVDKAPVVVAKGEGRIARHIKEVAAENGVPLVENKPVARLLYKTTRVGGTIPLELFQAVAQILAHVYRTHRYYFYRLKAHRMAERAENGAKNA